ncbi:MAG: hypothetical protein ACI36Y_08150, partial [Coriobacteriales bacterium]
MTTSIMHRSVRWGVALAASAAIALGGAALFAPQAQAATGTPISSVEDLKKINLKPADDYYLTNDIDFTGVSYWKISGLFRGTFDGNGYKFLNFHSTNSYTGGSAYTLFARSSGATFKNIKIEGFTADINSGMKLNLELAGLVANATNTTFDNVTVSGSIKVDSPSREASAYDYIGGVAA